MTVSVNKPSCLHVLHSFNNYNDRCIYQFQMQTAYVVWSFGSNTTNFIESGSCHQVMRSQM